MARGPTRRPERAPAQAQLPWDEPGPSGTPAPLEAADPEAVLPAPLRGRPWSAKLARKLRGDPWAAQSYLRGHLKLATEPAERAALQRLLDEVRQRALEEPGRPS